MDQHVMTTMRSRTDESLLRRIAEGQESAAGALYTRYSDRIRGLARAQFPGHLLARTDPDDVVQSVFRAFFESARKGLYQVPDGDTLWRLLAVVTINKVRSLNQFHGAARRDARSTVAWGSEQSEIATLASPLLEIAVQDVLEHLPPAERGVVELRLESFEIAEIAGRTGRSKRSVERLLQKARERLSELMGPIPV
jgi:RNA polymerase sigma-70 factor (ECF subfamily)